MNIRELFEKGINVSIEQEELLKEIKEDIELYGKEMKVLAVYSYREVDDIGEVEYISDYVYKELDEDILKYCTEEEREQAIQEHNENIESLKETKHKEMCLDDLLEIIDFQNKRIKEL